MGGGFPEEEVLGVHEQRICFSPALRLQTRRQLRDSGHGFLGTVFFPPAASAAKTSLRDGS